MCARALKPSAVFDEPYIHTGQDSLKKKGNTDAPIDKDFRGDIGVHGFWKTGQSTIFDIRVTDTDCVVSWCDRDPHKVLAQHKMRRRSDTPLHALIGGVLSRHLSCRLTAWSQWKPALPSSGWPLFSPKNGNDHIL
jgi:hypothetical protein